VSLTANLSLVFDLLARDNASPAFRNVGDAAENTGRRLRGVGDDVDNAGKKAGAFGGAFGGAMKVAGAAVIASGVLSVGKDLLNLASNAEQSMGGVEAVFKGYADTVKKNSKEAATALGLSGNSYRELATVIGSQLKNAGVPMDALGGKTDSLISMGADLSAMFGGTTSEAVDALSSALKGEMDPIEKYGISLNDAALKAEAMSLGLYNGKGNLDANAKAMAVMSLVTKQGADAVGAFGRESDTAAGRQARATAQWENLKTTIGDKLLPVWTGMMGFVSDKLLPGLEKVGGYIGATLGPIFSTIGDTVKVVTDALFKGEFNGGPFQEDSPFVNALFTVREAFGTIKDAVSGLFDAFKGGDAGGGVSGFFERIGAGIEAALPVIVEKIAGLGRALIDWIGPKIGPALEQLSEWMRALGEWVYGTGLPLLVGKLGEWGKALVEWIGPQIPPLLQKLGEFAWSLVDWVLNTGLPLLLDNLKKWADALIDWIKPQIPPLLEKLGEFLTGAIDWILTEGIPKLAGALLKLAGELLSWVLPKLPGLLLDFAQLIAGVVGWILTDGLPALAKGLSELAGKGITAFWESIENSALFTKLREIFGGAVDIVKEKWDALKEKVKEPIRIVFTWVNENMIDPINTLLGKFPGGLKIDRLPQLAGGGIVRGPGSGTSDSILGIDPRTGIPTAHVSNGEMVVNAEATKRNRSLLEAINAGYYAKGGEVGGPLGFLDTAFDWAKELAAKGGRKVAGLVLEPLRNAAKGLIGDNVIGQVLKGTIDKLVDGVLGKGDDADKSTASGPLGDGAVGGSWQALWAKVHAQFPSARMTSNYRPGDPGYHGKGKAVDVAGARPGDAAAMSAINRWAASAMGANLSQLIYTPGVNLLNGKPHTYNAATRADHFDHVHMATYDDGGWLKPGYTMAYNGTGKAERIRTAEQEAALSGGPVAISLQLDGPAVTDLLNGRIVNVVSGVTRTFNAQGVRA
jgi:hypothetical protein